MPALPIDSDQIVITASRAPEAERHTPASVTILDQDRLGRLGEPLLPALLRLTPSVAVTNQGPAGLLTEVRIRGAENNHTLLFIDGIRANDPATGDFARFELLNADLVSRLEVVRGPQSALWGSSAIGGVVAVNGVDQPQAYSATGETGSFGLVRGSGSLGIGNERGSLAGAIGWQRANGIDSFSGTGDKDGYKNLSARLRGTFQITRAIEAGVAAFALTGRTDFDGYDPISFEHSDTLDNSRNRLAGGRVWLVLDNDSAWHGRIGGSVVGSSNRNYLHADPVNRTSGGRWTLDAQAEGRFATGVIAHRLVLAADLERESFRSRDTIYEGATNQDRDRSHAAFTGEWRADVGRLTADFALRRDIFNRFRDATSVRVSLRTELGRGFAVAGSYAEGIAQPTFFDLYGFFPGNFNGNPDLKPESSRGFEGSLRFQRPQIAAALTFYRQRLHDEIVDNETFTSVINSPGTSRREGIEAEFAWRPSTAIRLTGNYAYLRATQPTGALNRQLQEWRRPRHSGSLAADGSSGKFNYGASLAYVGSHLDRQEVLPFAVVRLDSYWLASARIAHRVGKGLELFARATNVLDEDYEDSAGYRTEGRGLFVGLRLLADRQSSP